MEFFNSGMVRRIEEDTEYAFSLRALLEISPNQMIAKYLSRLYKEVTGRTWLIVNTLFDSNAQITPRLRRII